MEVNLLGPFVVRDAQAPVLLRGRGEQNLLALLALSAGRVVPSSRLIDDLWDDDALPSDPVNALHLRVSKLRRALGSSGDVVRRQSSGYVYALEPQTVDVHQFTAIVARARASGDPRHAEELYRRALALWRGQPLEDLGEARWARIEAGRLGELQVAVLAEHADRLLTLGRFEDVAAALGPAVAADPTRERLVAQLMTALFNAGRQREALEAFGRTRRALAEELGIDPSRDLRLVMERILRQDVATLGTPRPPATAPTAPAARQGRGHGNLPRRRTSFVGRASDLDRAARFLRPGVLVTLVGPGGAGKTSLAIEAARASSERFRDGAWLVRLAPLTQGGGVPHAIADALTLGLEGGTAALRPVDVLVSHLADRELLMVLDNCEHVVEDAAAVVDAILDQCPGVAVLATSREALATPDETQVVVAPLPVPQEGTPPARVVDYPAARLFLDRARGTDPDRAFDDVELEHVVTICRRLDGIPLALELAAARLPTLSTADLAERVRDRFALLTHGNRTAEARQQTLRAAVDWSHAMLTDPEQVLFRRLAVFRGGCSLPAAEAVLSGGPVDPASVLDLLDSLVRKSLVTTEATATGMRYRMLETLRQYADERLAAVPGERADMIDAHADHYLELAEQAETGLRGDGQGQWQDRLRQDHANLSAALDRLVGERVDAERALRLAGSLGLYWHMGRHLEGRRVLGAVLALPGGSPAARARALQALSLVERPRACIVHPSEQCAAAARESLDLFEQAGDPRRAAVSRLLLAVEGVGSDTTGEAADQLAAADEEFTRLGDAWGRAVVAFIRMEIQFKRGDEASARVAGTHAVDLFRSLGDGWGLSAVLYHLGYGLQRFGAFAESVDVLTEAIEVATAAGVHNTVQWATADLGLALLSLGRLEEASEQFARAGAASDQVGDDAGHLLSRYADALLAERRGDHAAARASFAAAYEGFARLGVWLATGLALAGTARCNTAAGDLATARDAYAQLLDLADTSGEVTLQLLGLEGLAEVTVDDDPAAAAESLERAAALRERLGRPRADDERARIEPVLQRLRTAAQQG